MPEGPEVKIASFYYNSFFDGAKNITFEILSEYYEKKYADVFECVKQYHPKYFQATFTIGKNIFLPLSNGQYFNFHLGMTGGWSENNIKHCHFKVSAEDRQLFFRDVRKFGKMRILNKEQIGKIPNWIKKNLKDCKVIGNSKKVILTKNGQKFHLDNKLNDLAGNEWSYFLRSVINTRYSTSGEEGYAHHIRKIHPSPKPPQLMRDIIKFFTNTCASLNLKSQI